MHGGRDDLFAKVSRLNICYLVLFWIVILISPEWNHRKSADLKRGHLPHIDGSMQSNPEAPHRNAPSMHEHSQQSPSSKLQSWGKRFERARGEGEKSTLGN